MKTANIQWRRNLRTAFALTVLVGVGILTWLLGQVEYRRFSSPDGAYTAIVTYSRYKNFLLGFPGQGSDKSGFITMEDSKGRNLGTIPLDILWMSQDLQWNNNGAEIRLVGEWNFQKKEYRYWNDEGTKEFVKQSR